MIDFSDVVGKLQNEYEYCGSLGALDSFAEFFEKFKSNSPLPVDDSFFQWSLEKDSFKKP